MDFYFDTNFYRRLVHSKNSDDINHTIQNLINYERKKSINSFAHVYVLAELLSHLNDIKDPAYDNCRSSVIAIWNHCFDHSLGKFRFNTDFDSFFASYLFRKNIDSSYQTYQKFYEIISYINNNISDYELLNKKEELEAINQSVNELEDQFIERYRKFILYTEPGAENWQLYKNDKNFRSRNLEFLSSKEAIKLISELEINKIANFVNINLNQTELNRYSEVLINDFKLHIMMQINIIKKIIISGCDFTKAKRSNWLWDLNIAACVQTGNSKNPERFSLVTSDKDILNSASECGCKDRVFNFDEYFELIHQKLTANLDIKLTGRSRDLPSDIT